MKTSGCKTIQNQSGVVWFGGMMGVCWGMFEGVLGVFAGYIWVYKSYNNI